jgi:hexokinase
MTDLPQDLLEQIKQFEEAFTVDTAKLKQIVDHFVKELTKGMRRKINKLDISNKICTSQASPSKVATL